MATALKIAVYWRGSEAPRADILQGLSQRKFRIREASSVSDVVSYLLRYGKPLVLADGTSSEAEVNSRLLELSSIEHIGDCPIVLLGSPASDKSDALAKISATFAAIDSPYDPEETASIIEKVWHSANQEGSARNGSNTDSVAGIRRPKPESTASRKRQRTEHALPLSDEQKKLVSKAGAILAGGGNVSAIDADSFVPEHPCKSFIVDAINKMDQEDQWIGAHARRSSTVSTIASNIAAIEEQRIDNIRLSCLLLNVSTIVLGTPGAHIDLTRLGTNGTEKQTLAEMYRSSADFAKEELKDEKLYRTINAVSSLLLNEPVSDQFSILNDAQCVLGAEFIDRCCWADGVWDPIGANRVIRNLRSADSIINDDVLLSIFTKIVGEAVVANPRLTNTHIVDRETLEKALNMPAIGDGETYVDVSDLAPGMTLSQPIKTLDGLIVVPGNLTLDSDLIRRLWQLAGVRAVGTKVAVISESF